MVSNYPRLYLGPQIFAPNFLTLIYFKKNIVTPKQNFPFFFTSKFVTQTCRCQIMPTSDLQASTPATPAHQFSLLISPLPLGTKLKWDSSRPFWPLVVREACSHSNKNQNSISLGTPSSASSYYSYDTSKSKTTIWNYFYNENYDI